MTDSILQSYQRQTYTTVVPFEVAVVEPEEGAMLLLENETDGWAFDATEYDTINAASYAGDPIGGTVAVKDTGTPANDLDNVPLNKSNMTNATTGAKMVHWDSAPYVRWSPHNYVLQSQTLGTSWTATAITVTDNDDTAPDSTVTAEKLVESNTSTSVLRVTSGITVLSGFAYSYSFYIKPSNITWIALTVGSSSTDTNGVRGWFNVSSGATGTLSNIGSGWTGISSSIAAAGSYYRCTIVFTTGGTTLFPSIFSATADAGTTRVTSGTYWAWGAQLNRGIYPTVYLVTTTAARYGISQQYDPVASVFGMWKDGQARFNHLTWNQDLTNAAWTKTDTTLSGYGSTSAPDGTNNAILCTEGTAGTASIVQAAFSGGNTEQNSCWSAYLKRGNTDWIRLKATDVDVSSNTYTGWFNLNTGAAGTVTYTGLAHSNSGFSGVKIIAIGGGWYRCMVSGRMSTVNLGDFTYTVEVSSASADASTTRVNNATYNIFSAQFDMNDRFAASNTQTLGSALATTRDEVGFLFSTTPTMTAHSVYLKWKRYGQGDDNMYWSDDGTSANVARRENNGATNYHRFVVVSASVTVVDTPFPATTNPDVVNKSAWRVQLNDFAQFLNGTQSPATDTSCALPIGLTRVNFNNSSGGIGNDHWYYQCVLYPRALNNTELDTVST